MAMVGARATELTEELKDEANARMKAAALLGNKTRHKKPSPAQELIPEPANRGQTRDAVGKTIGVSGRLIDFAKVVMPSAAVVGKMPTTPSVGNYVGDLHS